MSKGKLFVRKTIEGWKIERGPLPAQPGAGAHKDRRERRKRTRGARLAVTLREWNQ